jgi:hypothetical protein
LNHDFFTTFSTEAATDVSRDTAAATFFNFGTHHERLFARAIMGSFTDEVVVSAISSIPTGIYFWGFIFISIRLNRLFFDGCAHPINLAI